MSVTVNIPSGLQDCTNGQAIVEVNGNTVGQCLDELVKQFPSIEKELFDNKGELLSYVHVYVNLENSYPQGLGKLVADGDQFDIVFFTILGG